jgi:hypothetical protein
MDNNFDDGTWFYDDDGNRVKGTLPEPYDDTLVDLAYEHVYQNTNGQFTKSQKEEIIELLVKFKCPEVILDAEIYQLAYERASRKLMFVLSCMDSMMNCPPDKSSVMWKQIAYALGLQSTGDKTQNQVALECGISKASFSKQVTTFLRMTSLPGSFGLKSEQAKKSYKDCKRKNRKTKA